MLDQRYANLTSIDSYIQPLLSRVLSIDNLGIAWEAIDVDSVTSSCGEVLGDRFKLSIPYASYNVTWNVLFDSHCPEMGPDFMFNDNSFLANVDVDTLSAKVPSLAKWDPNDRDALLNVLLELIACYKQHQILLLEKQNRLSVEYTILMASEMVKPEEVEMILLPSSIRPTEARFVIGLSVDISELAYGAESGKGMLVVTYSGPDWTRITLKFHFSNSLEKAIGEQNTFHLPAFSPETCLKDYVQDMKKRLQNKANSVADRLKKRREYISAAMSLLGMSTLEYDAQNFTYISLLLFGSGICFVFHIKLSLGFPKEAPKLTFQSIYHMDSHKENLSEEIEKYSYHHSWSPFQMCSHLPNIIKNYFKKFEQHSIEKCD